MEEKIRKLPIFQELPDAAIEDVLSCAETVVLEPDEILFEKGEAGSELYTIISGLLKISVQDSYTGREKTIAMLGDGEVVGEMASLGGQKRSARASAMNETALLKVERDVFLDIFAKYPRIGLNLISALSKRLLSSDEEIHRLTFQTIPGRLAACLLKLAERFGAESREGRKIEITLTHQRLADLVGTNRETVTRYLKKFKNNGSVKVEGHFITILDRDLLENWL
ncbi:MAG: Crp/Fnr family transcriptional regulator [bacterium]